MRPATCLDEIKRFARRRPMAFLALAAAAGVLVGRIGRGAVAANTSLDSPDDRTGPGVYRHARRWSARTRWLPATPG